MKYLKNYKQVLEVGMQKLITFWLTIIFSLMSGKLNKQEQVQVVIRLKPVPKDLINTRSVYVSDEQEKTLVVETPNKKEYFVFDNIADDNCSQQEIYQYIGQDAVKSSTQGYNCCIFAYGQTGAGKTYSILGNQQDIVHDIYAQSRGILPRLLQDLFSWCQNETDRFWIKCSYLEIYNQQIIDLLNPDLKLRQMREDFKRGVFVQGLSQQNATNYEEAINILMKGVKNRKTSATSMNDESSRSHTIFTLNVQSEILKDDITKIRRSKINIVDLAGSQRAKQTKVEGERLKQGCNINKSLHVLGNVINALVQSSKKKKHIPFRDSKLTHFLKDSLCGNSITKLLANVHPSKQYLGDTLSTLMFAKRAKILKMKVQVNQNMTQNFQQLRKQIRKLRQQLAEARYIKNDEKVTQNISQSQNDNTQNIQKIVDVSNFDSPKHEQILQIFEQNQINYKGLIQIYEEHMKICVLNNKSRKSLNMHQQWKHLQRKNEKYHNLLKNMPAFTRIFKQNIKLKTQNKQSAQKQKQCSHSFKEIQALSLSSIALKQKQSQKQNQKQNQSFSNNQVAQIKSEYQALIKQIETKFTVYIQQLESAYEELQDQLKTKDQRIKQFRKRKELPPDMQDLTNQNEYLKLNILQLEEEINKLEQKQRKLQIQLKQVKKQKEYLQFEDLAHQDELEMSSKLAQIKSILDKQSKQHEEQRNSMLNYIDKVKQKLIACIEENKALTEGIEHLKLQNKGMKKKLHSILKINNEMQITKDQNTYTNTFWTNQQSNFSQQLEIFNEKTKNQTMIQKQDHSKSKMQWQLDEEKAKGMELSNQIIKLHKSYNQQISKLRDQIKSLQRARRQLNEQNFEIVNKLRKYEQYTQQQRQIKQYKKSKQQLYVQQTTLSHTKSTRALNKLKEPQNFIHFSKYKSEKEKGQNSSHKNSISSLNSKKILRIREGEDEQKKSS